MRRLSTTSCDCSLQYCLGQIGDGSRDGGILEEHDRDCELVVEARGEEVSVEDDVPRLERPCPYCKGIGCRECKGGGIIP